MELWIRSQGNYEANITPRLIKANDISLDYCGENDSYYILVNNGIEVAYYNSEKRALEILDEIQNLIKPIMLFQNCECDYDTLKAIKKIGACVVNNDAKIEQINQTVFYEIPKE